MHKIISPKNIISDRGNLLELDITNLPFIPKRFFFVDNVEIGGIRGNHAHLKDDQLLVCTNGQLEITTINKEDINIQNISRSQVIYIPILTWCSIKFLTHNASFMCICSESYDESEYIRDFNKFKEIIL
jgi:dTDP-4-dehydrorhamnose 3,5-epimerase-like enzyme